MFSMPQTLPQLLGSVIDLLIALIVIEVVISYLIMFGVRISPHLPFVKFIRSVVNPFLDPVRRLLPPYKTGGWDLSPMIVILLLSFMQNFLWLR